MTKTQEWIAKDNEYLINWTNRYPVVLEKGKGALLWDVEGKEYVDVLAGIAVMSVGHSNPKVIAAMKEQADKLVQCFTYHHTIPAIKLGKRLVELSCMDKAFFVCSGSEANENAIKIAKKYMDKKCGQGKKYEVICADKAFHGRTLTQMSACGTEKYHKGWEEIIPQFIKHVPYNDLDALKAAITDKTMAVMLEAVQGEGGVYPATKEYYQGVRKLCDEKDILFIDDEVQDGMGRTGYLFAYEDFGIEPDIITLAKAMGGGVPISTVLTKDKIVAALKPGDVGGTYSGEPFTCATSLAAINYIVEEDLPGQAKEKGTYFMGKLNKLVDKYGFVKEVRGKGLMIGLDIGFNTHDIVGKMLEKGVIASASGNVIRMVPPLVITKEQLDKVVQVIDDVLAGVDSAKIEAAVTK